MKRLAALHVLWLVCLAMQAGAHEFRPAYLELTQTAADRFDVLWKVPARGESLRLGLYVNLPEGTETLTEPLGVFVGGAYLERWSVRHPAAMVDGTIRVDGLRSTLTDVLVRIEWLDGSTQVTQLLPESPVMVVEARPGAWHVARTYFALGVEHILLGFDHLLFVLGLLLLVQGWRNLCATITAFTVAHSITLAAATLSVLHVPGPPVEAVIALSIAFVAAEVLHANRGQTGITQRWPWLVALTFGLLHGLGFAGALSEIGLPSQEVPLALLFFNVGVEAGQLLFIVAVLAAAMMLTGVWRQRPAWTPLILPYVIGTLSIFWVFERVSRF